MSRRISQRDLRHDADSYRFGDAMTMCEGYSPACSEQGRCLRDGYCFGSAPHLVAARMIERLIRPEGTGQHLAYLRKCADLLRNDGICL